MGSELDSRRAKYENLKEQLDSTDETQVPTSDLDARALPLQMRIFGKEYNLLFALDLFNNQDVLHQAKEELDGLKGADYKYEPLLGDREPPLDYRK